MALDYAALAASELGNVSDRRCYLLLEGENTAFLHFTKNSGINSGFMIPQYTTAALAAKIKPMFSSQRRQYSNIFGSRRSCFNGFNFSAQIQSNFDNLEFIQTIELIYATQTIEFRRPLKSSKLLEEIIALTRKELAFKEEDDGLYHDINAAHKIITSFVISKKQRAK